jgi:voltage-gated potassium channel Kch/K+/H+ antiporter YhaU regulatory subunit KhtT
MSKGTLAPLIFLVLISVVAVFLLAIALWLINPEISFGSGFYDTVLRLLDPGVVADDNPSKWDIVPLFVATILGLIVISALIAIVNNGVMNKLGELRKGRSLVIEEGHTVILGWSFQVFPIIQELCIANSNLKKATIVVLADEDKVMMEDDIKIHVQDFGVTKVVCRSGDPIDIHDLRIANLDNAKSIIITAPESGDSDSQVIKTILAITNNPHRIPLDQKKYHIVAEIRNPQNISIAKIAGKDEVELVVFDDLISRITAQTCRQPGLSVVFTELLDFSGDEIYFQREDRLIGKSFVEAMFSYDTSTIIGIRKKNGKILIRPDLDTVIELGDMMIAVSEDDDTVVLSGIKNYNVDISAITTEVVQVRPEPENTLIIGWNRRGYLIVRELDKYVAPGSKIDILSHLRDTENDIKEFCKKLPNSEIATFYGETSNRITLDKLNISNYDHIIVLSQEDSYGMQSSDAKTLSTLLHLRDIADNTDHKFSIVSEMLDDRNRELAEITHADDFIVSVKLDSLMLTQIAENKELKDIFEAIFSSGGPAISIKPVEDYVKLGKAVNFYTVTEAASQRGELALGYKLQNKDHIDDTELVLAHGVVVNPVKSHEVFFIKGDKIIVLGLDTAS